MSRDYRELLDKELDTVSGGIVEIGSDRASDSVVNKQVVNGEGVREESMLDVAAKSEQRRVELVNRFVKPSVKNQFTAGKDATAPLSTWARISLAFKSFFSKK